MEFDVKKTIELIKGGLLDREKTWQSYLAGNLPWLQTATVLTGPLLLANIVLTAIFRALPEAIIPMATAISSWR